MKTLEVEAHIGPIVYIADAFGLSTDNATKYIILLLIFVFEPLAIVLSICLNVVVFNRPSESQQKVVERTSDESAPDEVDAPDDAVDQRPPLDDIVVDLITNPVTYWTSASVAVASTDQQQQVEPVLDVDTSADVDDNIEQVDDQETVAPLAEGKVSNSFLEII